MNERTTILGDVWNLPRQVSELKGKDPGIYLQFNTHMVTFYQQTYGELSRFFLALRDGRLIGSHCGTCKQVMVPAATWHCPTCGFVEMTEVDLPHRGILAATAPITIFPSASFIGDAPFARGFAKSSCEASSGFLSRSFAGTSLIGTQKMSRIDPMRSSSKTSFSSTPFTKMPGRGRPVVVRRRDGRNEAMGASRATST